jgi:hypothetical protein
MSDREDLEMERRDNRTDMDRALAVAGLLATGCIPEMPRPGCPPIFSHPSR